MKIELEANEVTMLFLIESMLLGCAIASRDRGMAREIIPTLIQMSHDPRIDLKDGGTIDQLMTKALDAVPDAPSDPRAKLYTEEPLP